MFEVESGKRNFYRCRPPIGCDVSRRGPHSVPAPVEVAAIAVSLLLYDQAVVLCSKGIDPEYICSAAIVVRIDQDFEVVIQFLADIPAQFRRGDPGCLRVIAMNSEIHCVARIEYSYLGLLRRRLTFIRLSLPKVSDRGSQLPEWVVQSTIKLWGFVGGCCFHPGSGSLVCCVI